MSNKNEKNTPRAVRRVRTAFGFRLAVSLLAFVIPFAFLFGITFLTPSQYEYTFLGELSHKYERLYSIDEPKIVIVGGSSTAFGLDSKMLEEYTGMKVVNFGLYATLGTKVMLDLSREAINEGDIVIVAPETDAQTLSLYYNAETTWQAMDGSFEMLGHIDRENASDMVGAFFGFASKKLGYLLNGNPPDPDGVYRQDSFNEYGDICYPRPSNTMPLGYDPNMTVDFSTESFSEDFIDYLNVYIDDVRGKGAEVYYSFPPINDSCLAPTVTDEVIAEYYDFISRSLNCDVISDVKDYILHENYFFDSNFHLNDSGVVVRTAALIKDILRAMGDTRTVSIELPEPPPRQSVGGDLGGGDNSYAEYFTYEDFAGGLMITGITEEGRGFKNITVPTAYDGKAVLAIGEGAFSGCELLRTVTVNGNILQFYERVFDGCTALESIYMHYDSAEGIAVGEDLLGGTSADLYMMSEAGFESFTTDYFWSPYSANGGRIKRGY